MEHFFSTRNVERKKNIPTISANKSAGCNVYVPSLHTYTTLYFPKKKTTFYWSVYTREKSNRNTLFGYIEIYYLEKNMKSIHV